MKDPIDLHIGLRIRNRRWLQNLTQSNLGNLIGIRFQQIQKYEKGDNRVSASRLWDLARALQVPVAYFYDGLENHVAAADDGELLHQKETAALVRAYYRMDDRPRKTFLELAIAVGNEAARADLDAAGSSPNSKAAA